MSIKLKLEGFDDLLKDIERAGGRIDDATKKCMVKSADIMQDTLKAEMEKANADKDVINAMPAPTIENDYGRITARVGYRKGTYDPHNLSDGYKVVFVNYGTPYRKKHGKIEGKTVRLGFIQRAKNKAKRKIEKTQEETLHEILRGLR